MFSIRNFRPTSQLAILLLAWIWIIWKSIAYSDTTTVATIYEPLSKFFFSLSAQGSPLNVVLGIFILLFQALYLSYALQKHNIIERNNWLPAILFIILSGMASNFVLTPVTFANLFILLALDRMFESYESSKGIDNVLLAGFYSTIAMLFYFPYILFAVAILVGLIILRNLNWRYFIITIIGISIPVLYLGTIFFINDNLRNEIKEVNQLFHNIFPSLQKINYDGIVLFIIIIFLMVVSIFHLVINQQGKLIKTRKKTSLIITYSIFSIVIAFISLHSFNESLIGLTLFASTTIALQVSTSKSNLFSAIIFWIVIAITLLSNFGIL